MKNDAQPSKPVYPHSVWIADLLKESETRLLTKAECIVITEAQMFESLITEALPKLRKMVAEIPEGLAHDNAQMYIEVAADFAKGMAGDISVAMQNAMKKAAIFAVSH